MSEDYWWVDIKNVSPPSNKKIMVRYLNELEKPRTVFALYAEKGAVEILDGDDDDYDVIDGLCYLPEGWWEIVESPYCDCVYFMLGGEPVKWMNVPE